MPAKSKKKAVKPRRKGVVFVGKAFKLLLLAVNVAIAVVMVASAYCAYVNPITHPTPSSCGIAFPALLAANVFCLLFWLLVWWRGAAISLVAILCCANAAWRTFPLNFHRPAPPENSIKVLSYNVKYFNALQPHTATQPNEVLAYLQASDADIICLQEYAFSPACLAEKAINDALKAYPYKSVTPIISKNNGLACYARYPILSSRRVDYPSPGNGSAIYELLVEGDTVVVINNHLESNHITAYDQSIYKDMLLNPELGKVKEGSKFLIHRLAETVPLRSQQADSIAAYIAQNEGRAMVVCGDLNATPYSYAYRVISQRLVDSFCESGQGLGISYHERGFYFRIDYMLHSDHFKSYRCEIDNSIAASDHYPIWCYLTKKSRK